MRSPATCWDAFSTTPEFTADARLQYEAFLQRAARNAPEHAWVRERVQQLRVASQ